MSLTINPNNIDIGDPIVGGTAGSVLFVDASGNLGQDNANFLWDDSTKQLSVPAGDASAPSYSFVGELDTGIFNQFGGQVSFASNGIDIATITNSNSLRLTSTAFFGFASGASASTGMDVVLRRDAANILALKNSTNAQEYRIYNTDVAANDEFVSLGFINNSNVFTIETEALAAGTVRDIALMGGDVGIGTATPDADLEVVSTSTATPRGIVSTQYSNTTNSAQVLQRKARGTEATPLAILSSDVLGFNAYYGYDGSAFDDGGAILFSATQNWTTSNQGTAGKFYVTRNNENSRSISLSLEENGDIFFGESFDDIRTFWGAAQDLSKYFSGVRSIEEQSTTDSDWWFHNTTAENTSNEVRFDHRLETSGGNTRTSLRIVSNFDDVTDATRNSNILIQGQNGGTFETFAAINGGDWDFQDGLLTTTGTGTFGDGTTTNQLIVNGSDGAILIQTTNTTAGAGFQLKENTGGSGGNWKFKVTAAETFKIRDEKNTADRLVINTSGDIELQIDNQPISFGTGQDADITYNGTNLVISPKVVGSGNVTVDGSVVSATDSTDDLGTSSIFWANAYIDKIFLNTNSIIDSATDGIVSIGADGTEEMLRITSSTQNTYFQATNIGLILGHNLFRDGGAWATDDETQKSAAIRFQQSGGEPITFIFAAAASTPSPTTGYSFGDDKAQFNLDLEGTNIEPKADTTYQLGDNSRRWQLIFVDAINVGTVAKTGAFTATNSDHVILCDASSAAFTITLPTAALQGLGRTYHIKKTDSSGNAITVDANGSQTIDGALTATITTQYESIMIVSDGSNWHII